MVRGLSHVLVAVRGKTQPELSAAIIGLERVLVISQTSKTTMFTFLPTGPWSIAPKSAFFPL